MNKIDKAIETTKTMLRAAHEQIPIEDMKNILQKLEEYKN